VPLYRGDQLTYELGRLPRSRDERRDHRASRTSRARKRRQLRGHTCLCTQHGPCFRQHVVRGDCRQRSNLRVCRSADRVRRSDPACLSWTHRRRRLRDTSAKTRDQESDNRASSSRHHKNLSTIG
jgi:hypothetical protein